MSSRTHRRRGSPRLVADRFLARAGEQAIDLGTGERVRLVRSPHDTSSPPNDAWRVPQPGEVVLDEGWVNAGVRFVAFGAASGEIDDARLPTASRGDDRVPADAELDPFLEVLDAAIPGSVRGCTAHAAPAIASALLRALARASRLRGIVPVGVQLLRRRASGVLAVARNRSALVLVPPHIAAGDRGWVNAQIVRAGLEGARVVAVVSTSRALPAGPAIAVRGVPARGAPCAALTGTDRGWARVAERADELEEPGRDGALPDESSRALVEALPPVPCEPVRTDGRDDASHPLAVRCRHRLERAERLLSAGRRSAAVRAWRQVSGIAGSLPAARRQAFVADVSLARVWLEAGRAAAALRAAADACGHAQQAGDGDGVLCAVALRGHALVDLARVGDAAAVLEAGRAARAGAWVDGRGEVALALARCRAWQGAFGVARRLVDEVLASSDGDLRAWALVRAVRIELLAGRVTDAARRAEALSAVARPAVPPQLRAAVALARARLAACTGDATALRAHVAEGLAACRASGLRAQAVRLRLALLAGRQASGDGRGVRHLTRALSRDRDRGAPPLLRVQIDAAFAAVRGRGRNAVERLAVRCRLPALATTTGREAGPMDELLEVLTICHEAEDDNATLDRVCALLRQRLDAAAVTVVREGSLARLAGAGQRAPSTDIAARVIATGRVVPAERSEDGLEAAAPVRCHGATVGALACRWPIDGHVDVGRASALLAAAAAACAPSVHAAIERQVRVCADEGADLGLLGTSAEIARVRTDVRRAAAVPFHVLVEGESGAGKELVARAIHRTGPRRAQKFRAVNCAALTDDLLEAELFGHARGAFTGAVAERVGLFEDADGGTLFLDEVGELTPRAQAKLLRVIQEGEVRRIGENLPRRIDVRIVAATNRPLAGEVSAGRFRADLRYRLEVIRVMVPPLRARPGDIPLLAHRFWQECAARAGSRARLDAGTLDVLTRYPWPGNVRELQNVMAALAAAAPRVGRVRVADLPAAVLGVASEPGGTPRGTLDEARRVFEARYVTEALRRAGGRPGEAARALGLSRQGLAKLVARLGIEVPVVCRAPDAGTRTRREDDRSGAAGSGEATISGAGEASCGTTEGAAFA